MDSFSVRAIALVQLRSLVKLAIAGVELIHRVEADRTRPVTVPGQVGDCLCRVGSPS
ncbi:hypothetical protein [Laspinema palackyanum]|uniref:hypothetical protein n=1 Tax=Laspinema palackyanum TaxID=3231601 RepID=UPI00345DD1B4|nr:hypothetical protein [Laspinema sp. D2c]